MIRFSSGSVSFSGLVFLAAPATSLVAGFFFDEIAGIVEPRSIPRGRRDAGAGRSTPRCSRCASPPCRSSSTLIALVLLFVPGLGVVAWIGANGYLLGREYFELAAMRFRPQRRSARDAPALRARRVLAGLVVAGFVAVPLLNLLTPLFATALMARLHKRLSRGT